MMNYVFYYVIQERDQMMLTINLWLITCIFIVLLAHLLINTSTGFPLFSPPYTSNSTIPRYGTLTSRQTDFPGYTGTENLVTTRAS